MGKKDQHREKASHNIPGSDNNGQSRTKLEGGEYRNGRLSQYKNHNPHDEAEAPNEYLNSKQEE